MDLLDYLTQNNFVIHLGVDFNVEHMAGLASVLIDGKIYVFKEYHNLLDTPELINAVRADFPHNKIIAYPDSTGIKRGSADAGITDIALLRKAKFVIRARNRNPYIKDRVASVNNAFNKKKLFIDTERCPETTECLEQQIWLPNGQPDKTTGLDHMMDALGYLVNYIMPVRELKPKQLSVVQ